MRNRRGFTLVEMSAIVVIVTLFAALAAPNLLSRQRTREVTAFFVRLPDLAVYAREYAQREDRIVRVRFDEAQRIFVAEADAAVSTTNQEESDEAQTIRQVSLPEDLEATSFRQEDESVSPGEWEITFYPDGRSDGADVEIDDDGRIRSISVSPEGTVRLEQGALPTINERRWPAGEREQRL
ncbi:MAG: pilus assembly FimT family protein [Fimbriimonas sp.]